VPSVGLVATPIVRLADGAEAEGDDGEAAGDDGEAAGDWPVAGAA
jgi:hypothetical protein